MKRLVLPCFALASLAAVGCSNTDDLFSSGSGGGGAAASSGTGATSGTTTTTTGSTVASGSTTSATSSGAGTTTSSTGGGTTTSSGPVTCGDGVVNQPSEQCDGGDLGGAACTDVGFSNPAGATCDAMCQVDYKTCMATCGDGAQEPTEGCDDANLVDTDTCSAKCQPQGDCNAPINIALNFGTIDVSGTTAGGTNAVTSTTCQDSTGPEVIYRVTPLHAGYLTIWTDPVATDFDAMIYVRNMCASMTDVACGDNNFAQPDLVSFQVGDQPVTVVLDGYQQQEGNFVVHFDLSTGADCNDPVPILLGDDNGFTERATGNTTGSNANETATCGGLGNDVVYRVTRMTDPGPFTATTTSQGALNSVTYARETCTNGTSQLACDSPINNSNSAITVNANQNPTFVFVDAQATQGGYSIAFDPTP